MKTDFSKNISALLENFAEEKTFNVFKGVAPGVSLDVGVPAQGIGFRVTPHHKPVQYLRDFVEKQIQNSYGEEIEFKQKIMAGRLSVVLHWPTLLRRAFVSNDTYAHIGRQLWQSWASAFRASDPVLAAYVFAPPEDSGALQAHIERMLAGPLAQKFFDACNEALFPVRDLKAEKALARCVPCLQAIADARRNGEPREHAAPPIRDCPACAGRRSFAAECSVFHLDLLRSKSPLFSGIQSPYRWLQRQQLPPCHRVVRDIGWLLASRVPFDGAVPLGRELQLHWGAYGWRLADAVRKSPLTLAALTPRLAERTALPADTALPFLEVMLSPDESITPSQRDEAALALGHAAREVILDAVEAFGVLYRGDINRWEIARLRAAYRHLTSPAAARQVRAGIRNLRAIKSGNRALKVLRVDLPTPAGPVETEFRRYGVNWLLRLPLALPVGVPVPRRQAYQQKANPDAADLWWSVDDLQSYANACERYGQSNASLQVQDIHDWFKSQAQAFALNPGLVREARRANERAEALAAGSNPRQWFTDTERQRVKAFLEDRPSPGALSAEEWAAVLDLLPGRSRSGLYRVIDALGLEYAQMHGYTAYSHSGYCIRSSARRRQAWLKKGVPLAS